MSIELLIILGVVAVMALIAVIIAIVAAVTTSSYDKSLTGKAGDEDFP